MAHPLRTLNRIVCSAGRRAGGLPLPGHGPHPGQLPLAVAALKSRGRPRLYYATSLDRHQDSLVLTSDEPGVARERRLSKLWLRDNCPCTQCTNQDTLQRNFKTFELPPDLDVQELRSGSDGIDILWSDSHKSHYTWAWLTSTMEGPSDEPVTTKLGRRLWNRTIANNPPEVEYARVMDDSSHQGMAELTNNIREYGFCFVVNSPKTPEDTKRLLESIGPIRNTHYGGFYDFIPDLALADTAYTNAALPAHTDTTYFTEPAGLQAFHLLSHAPPPGKPATPPANADADADASALGGRSLLVDGFYAAYRLRMESNRDFDVLRSVRIPWHASGNADVAVAPDRAYPVIEASARRIFRIRWNNDDRGVVPLVADVAAWYRAARKWDEMLRREVNEYWFQLEPGRILIFDNWRVLHGRSQFEGTRRICGGYINRDDFISRWKLSNFPRQDVIAANKQLR